MSIILDGKKLAAEINEANKDRISKLATKPVLATVFDPNDFGSKKYVEMKHKKANELGIQTVDVPVNENDTTESVLTKIDELNNDAKVNAILVQSPLPTKINQLKIFSAIDENKDADGLTAKNQGWMFGNHVDENFIAPATAQGIMNLLAEYKVEIKSKNVVVVGRSQLLGRPLTALFLNAGATVTIAHKYTPEAELIKQLQNADIVAVGVGIPEFIKPEWVKDGVVIVDAGANRMDGKTVGDVSAKAYEKSSYYTPVPGGVGPMTIATLLNNVTELTTRTK